MIDELYVMRSKTTRKTKDKRDIREQAIALIKSHPALAEEVARALKAQKSGAEIYNLTPKMLAVAKYVGTYVKANGFAPSYDEIASALGLKSRSSVGQHVQNLLERGVLTNLPRKARSLRLADGAAHIIAAQSDHQADQETDQNPERAGAMHAISPFLTYSALPCSPSQMAKPCGDISPPAELVENPSPVLPAPRNFIQQASARFQAKGSCR